jgi:hypothetical protein
VQVPLDDQVRVDRVVELVGQSGAAGTADQQGPARGAAAARGGRGRPAAPAPGAAAPTVLVTAWRARAARGPVDAVALRSELALAADAVQLPRGDDHVCCARPARRPARRAA